MELLIKMKLEKFIVLRNYNMVNSKRGNILIIWICLAMVVVMFIFFNMYVLYSQVDLQINEVRKDIFYIVQNSFFSMDMNEFKYYSYKVDSNVMKDKISELIYLNYKNRVNVESVSYDFNNNNVLIKYNVNFYPVVFKNLIGESLQFNFVDNVKLKNMEVLYE